MSVDFKELRKFENDIKRLNTVEREAFMIATLKELASRLLTMAIKRTPVDTGTLRRGWDVNSHLSVRKSGNTYLIDVINPVEYASYIEYGHRTPNQTGWVNGKFMLKLSKQELDAMTPTIIERKLKQFIEGVIK